MVRRTFHPGTRAWSVIAPALAATLSAPWSGADAHTNEFITGTPQVCGGSYQTKWGCGTYKLRPEDCVEVHSTYCNNTQSATIPHKNFYLNWNSSIPAPGVSTTVASHACYSTNGAHANNSLLLASGGVSAICLAPKHFMQRPEEDTPNLGPSCPQCGNPINPANGNKFQREQDYRATGPLPLAMERYYNSMDRRATSLGGWRHTYTRALRKDFGTLPMEDAPDVTTLHTTPSAACETGWGTIKSTVMGLAATTATYANDVCTLKEGTRVLATLPVYANNYLAPANPSLVAIVAERADGSSDRFTFDGSSFTPAPGVVATLEQVAAGYRLTDNDVVEEYDSDGVLLSLTTRAGFSQTLTYAGGKLQAVTDSFGRSLTFGYSGAQIVTVTDPDNQQYVYAYDASGRLEKATAPDGTFRKYLYGDTRFPKALTGIEVDNEVRFATWAYDDMGRATLSEHAGGAEAVDLTYNADGTATSVDALAASRTYTFVTVNGKFKSTATVESCGGCGTPSSSTTYDANGFVASRTDFTGNVTIYVHNTRGLEESRTEGFGTSLARTITTQWHATFHKPTQIDEPGRRTVYTYDPATGDRLTQTVTDLATSENRTTTWTYTTHGRVATVDGPRTDVPDVTTYTYYACMTGAECGQVHTITNALGHVTTVTTYDAHGNPLTIQDPNGVTTTLTYDARQRLKTRTVGGATTTFDYDGAGSLDMITLPDGSFLDYAYDNARRLTDIQDNAGNRIHYTLDAKGNRTTEEVFDPANVLKRKHSQVFNALGRLEDIKNAGGQVVRHYAYDDQGNRTDDIAYDDPSQVFDTLNEFDALNRMWRSTAPDGGVTQYGYNERDQLVSVTDPKSLPTVYGLNALGDLKQLTSPDTGVTSYTYDAAGNRKTQLDARGVQVDYSYDALNRLTFVNYPGSAEDVTYTYDSTAQPYGKGRLTGVTDAVGTTVLTYDARGNVTQEQRVIGGSTYTTGYGYDLADRLTSITYPSGRSVGYTRNSLGQVTTVTTTPPGGSPAIVAQGITYLPFGGVKSYVLGNGIVVTRTYDTDYRLQGILDAGSATVQHLDFDYDRRGNVTLRNDLVAAVPEIYGYDPMSRLSAASGAYGTQGYTYDDVGNRLTRTGSAPQMYGYPSNSHRLSSAGTTSFLYDGAGNTTTKGLLALTYNQAGRVATATLGANTVTNTYGANGQRVRKISVGLTPGTTVLHHGPGGQLIAEWIDTGLATSWREYVWLDDLPLAQASTAGLAYIHADQLNTPQKMTDSAQSTVWQASYEPFGGATVTSSGGYSNPLRFPGQYFDAETGLHQNWHRDYDPAIGRYLQSDPIGLEGGINTYAYALGNPITNFDPDGLSPVHVIAVGAIAIARCMRLPSCRARLGKLAKEAYEWCDSKIDCNIKRSPANHKKWPDHPAVDGKYAEHYEINCWIKGKSGSGFHIQIPLPGRTTTDGPTNEWLP